MSVFMTDHIPKSKEIEEKIVALQAELERMKKHEGAVSQVHEIIKQFNLTASDIFPSFRNRASAETKPKLRAKVTVRPKYRDPSTGKTWSGRGLSPKWLTAENRDEFLIKIG